MSPEQKAELDELMAEAEKTAHMTAAEFGSQYAVPFEPSLAYDPKTAEGLALLQATPLALDQDEMDKLGKAGFVISEKKHFPTFAYGYQSLYALDLPVYVSADSILHAVHRSYDAILKSVELASLAPEMQTLLQSMRGSLAAGGGSALGAAARADADLYTAVALALLTDKPVAPVAGATQSKIDALVAGAKAHQGIAEVELFGSTSDHGLLAVRAARPLHGLAGARALLPRDDVARPRRFPPRRDPARRLAGLPAPPARGRATSSARSRRAMPSRRFERIDGAIRAFVGEPDYMTLPELDALLADLGQSSERGPRGDPGREDRAGDRATAATARSASRATS